MSVTGKPPESWVKARRRVYRRDSREKLRAMSRRPLTVLAVAAVLVLGLAVGITAGLKSENIAGRYCQKVFLPAYFGASGWPQVSRAKHMPSAMILNPSTGIGPATRPTRPSRPRSGRRGGPASRSSDIPRPPTGRAPPRRSWPTSGTTRRGTG
jgi:hypothetical protein